MEPSTSLASGRIRYEHHRPETTLLYQLVERHYPEFLAALGERDRYLPSYVQQEFETYLKCGRLEHGFLRVHCTTCHAERLLAFSCKRRGFCPSCGARRMVESAALLVDEILPWEPIRQWVLSVPFPLRFLFAAEPAAMGEVLAIVWRAMAGRLIRKAGLTWATGQTGAVTLIQRFGSALNLNIHFHMLCLDGAYTAVLAGPAGQAAASRRKWLSGGGFVRLILLCHECFRPCVRDLAGDRRSLCRRGWRGGKPAWLSALHKGH
jgi:hypothetical protein